MQKVNQRRTTAFLFLILLFSSLQLHAQSKDENHQNTLSPLRIKKDIKITGDLSNPVWDKARSVSIKYEVQPDDDSPAPVDTKVKVLYSKNNLYIGFICNDPNPQKIRAHVADRDESFHDDFVGIFLDPFDSNQHAYEFFINPLGVQMDGMRTHNNEDMNYDVLWKSEGTINNSGYTAVMKIPFKSLHFPNQDVQNWSIQFIRNYPRNNRYQLVWTNVKIDNSCLMCQNGDLVGLKNVKSSNTVELLPYAMSYQNGSINNPDDPSSGFDNSPVRGRIGGSISYSPNSTTSLDAVVNPDFSQVETDATQIDANQTFALYYSEKRPFFMKGSDLFNTPEDLFYSRMINHPLAAGKVTQNSSKYSIAFLTAYDRDAAFVIPGKLGSSLIKSDVHAYDNILRGKYNIGNESYVGGLLTTRNQGEGFNYVGSLDWNLNLADHYYFSGQMGYSDTHELQDTTLFNDSRRFGHSSYDAAFNGQRYGGSLISAQFERQAKYYSFSAEYKSFSPTFQTQSGFVNQTDMRQFQASQNISWYPNKDWFSSGNLNINGSWRYDFAGQFMERYLYAGLYNQFGAQTSVSIGYLPLNDEEYRGRFFTAMYRTMINVNSNPMNELSFGGHLEIGRSIYRTENPTLGHGYNISAYTNIKPTPRLHLSLNYNYSTLSSLDNSQEYYSGDIIRLNSKYNFSRKLFLRFITQYNSFNKHFQVYPLLYYKLNPFTKFYIGMTDYLKKYNQPGPAGVNGLRQTNREFFVKFQYLIRS
ncbi:MAG TPA: sugar-binding protein [Balneolaceae bacterium]|nr:sugar-binding protein [Balneolaceae bacterium]